MSGVGFGYPEAAPVPAGAAVVATSEAWDNDDPVRGRVQVVQVPDSSWAAVQGAYESAYPASSGWQQRKSAYPQLCLVNTTDKNYDEVVDVAAYEGTRVKQDPRRYLVMVTRVERGMGECGAAWCWVEVDLLKPADTAH